MAKLVSFLNQKGGCGKSTLTIHFATYLHMLEGKNVTIIDCDSPQHSIVSSRRDDLNVVNQNVNLLTKFRNFERKEYQIYKATIPECLNLINSGTIDLTTKNDDIIFIDLPGTFNTEGYMDILSKIDCIIIPAESDKLSFTSMMMTIELISHVRDKQIPIYILWNKINSSASLSRIEPLEEYIYKFAQQKSLNLTVFKNRVKSLVGWQDYRSTLLPYPALKEYIEEFKELNVF